MNARSFIGVAGMVNDPVFNLYKNREEDIIYFHFNEEKPRQLFRSCTPFTIPWPELLPDHGTAHQRFRKTLPSHAKNEERCY